MMGKNILTTVIFISTLSVVSEIHAAAAMQASMMAYEGPTVAEDAAELISSLDSGDVERVESWLTTIKDSEKPIERGAKRKSKMKKHKTRVYKVVNYAAQSCFPPLSYAIQLSRDQQGKIISESVKLEMVKLLVEFGAEINGHFGMPSNALETAVRFNNWLAFDYLLKKGAWESKDLLDDAAMLLDPEQKIARELIRRGHKPTVFVAIRMRDEELLDRALLTTSDKAADLVFALDLAVKLRYRDMAQAVILRKASPTPHACALLGIGYRGEKRGKKLSNGQGSPVSLASPGSPAMRSLTALGADTSELLLNYVQRGEVEKLESLLALDPNAKTNIKRIFPYSRSLLMMALENPSSNVVQIVEVLLFYGVNAKQRDSLHGDTAAHYAVMLEEGQACEILKRLSRYAPLNDENNQGITPRSIAEKDNKGPLVKYLMANFLSEATKEQRRGKLRRGEKLQPRLPPDLMELVAEYTGEAVFMGQIQQACEAAAQ